MCNYIQNTNFSTLKLNCTLDIVHCGVAYYLNLLDFCSCAFYDRYYYQLLTRQKLSIHLHCVAKAVFRFIFILQTFMYRSEKQLLHSV